MCAVVCRSKCPEGYFENDDPVLLSTFADSWAAMDGEEKVMLMTLEERRKMAKRWEDGDLVAGEPKRLSKMASVYAKRACAALDEGLHPRKRVRLGERGSFKWVSVGVQSGCAKASK